MGDELRGENLVHLNVRFSTETELKKIQDFLYEKSGQGVSFTGLVEAMANEVTIVTAVHNIKSNKGSRTAGVDKIKMDKYLQMPKDELILLIQSSFRNYRPKPARREYVGRMYMEPHRQCKHKGNDTRRLKWAGVTPKYNYRYADDWVILTSTEKEALRLKRVLTKYFRNRMKLELSQEKTYVTDLRTNGIHFLGFVVKAERKRKTPDPATWTKHLVGKPLPDMERLGKKIKKLLEEVHRIELCQKVNVQAAQIQYVNSVIMGMAQYLQTSICSHAYHAIDRRVNNAALTVWKKLYPKRYNSMQVPLKVLCNLPDRHKGYDSKTFAVWVEGKWFGITYAFITHSHYEPKPFDQKMTPYTVEGRRRYVSYRAKHKPLPCDRPSVNSPNDIAMSAYAKGRMNFEYYMNREYAYSRDKGKCKCCGNAFSPVLQKHCHHVKNKLPLDRINKVPNLVWLCEPCHRMVHNSPIPPELDAKTVGKIMKYRERLKL